MTQPEHERCYGCGGFHDYEKPHYRVCFECGHLWPTEKELVDDHIAILFEMKWAPRMEDYAAANISICPKCTHDF